MICEVIERETRPNETHILSDKIRGEEDSTEFFMWGWRVHTQRCSVKYV